MNTLFVLSLKGVFFCSPPSRSTLTQFCSRSFFCFSGISAYLFPQLLLPPFVRSMDFFKSSFPSLFTLATFQKSVICAGFGKPAEKPGLRRDVAVFLFINMDGNPTRVRIATLWGRADDAICSLQRQMPN